MLPGGGPGQAVQDHGFSGRDSLDRETETVSIVFPFYSMVNL